MPKQYRLAWLPERLDNRFTVLCVPSMRLPFAPRKVGPLVLSSSTDGEFPVRDGVRL